MNLITLISLSFKFNFRIDFFFLTYTPIRLSAHQHPHASPDSHDQNFGYYSFIELEAQLMESWHGSL